MAGQEKWYFTRDQLVNSPSRKCGLDADKELAYRQQAANLIQDMGQRLQVSQLCINTAIVYMHRFYAFHSFTQFHRNAMAAASLFLAAKMEEQPRKLEHVIKVAHICLHRGDNQQTLDVRSDHYQEQTQDLVFNENVLLQTLGFDVAIDHPHTHVVKTCSLIRASKDLAQTSYFMASNSLHLTTMCLQYRPTVVACFCIHLASKWSNWEIPQSNEGKHWFNYVDRSVTAELLEHLTSEFLHIFDRCPSRLKKKIMSISHSQVAMLAGTGSPQQSSSQNSHGASGVAPSPFDKEPRKIPQEELDKMDPDKRSLFGPSTSAPGKVDYREYRERQLAPRRPPGAPSGAPPPGAPPPGAPPPGAPPPGAPPPGAAPRQPPRRWTGPPPPPAPRHPPQRRPDGRHSQGPPPEQRPRTSQPHPQAPLPPSPALPAPPPAAAPAPAPARPAALPPPAAPARAPSLFSPEPPARKPPRALALPDIKMPPQLSPLTSPEPKKEEEAEKIPSPIAPIVPIASAPLTNTLETDPNLVSSLLKESIPHRSEKKKKKEKHKHKDKDKRDDRKKHKKNKDKRREAEGAAPPPVVNASPIKITIPRDAIANAAEPTRLKIKIPKERLRTEPPVPAPQALKIKIPKEVVEGANRKRSLPVVEGPPHKAARTLPPPMPPAKGLGLIMGNGQHGSYQK